MSHANLVLLILIGILCSTIIADTNFFSCRRNKMWAECRTLCRRFCRSRLAEVCYGEEVCLYGCSCKEGYVKISTKNCIRPSECGKMRREDFLTYVHSTLLEDDTAK